jgi:hypothetical protein
MGKKRSSTKKKRGMAVGTIAAISASALLSVIFIFILLLPFLPIRKTTECFSSIGEILKYMSKKPEYPEPQNKNWVNPNYNWFYKKNLPSYWKRLKSKLGISKLRFSMDCFEHLLLQANEKYKANGYDGYFVLKIAAEPGTRFIVFGDLLGGDDDLTNNTFHLLLLNTTRDIPLNLKFVTGKRM